MPANEKLSKCSSFATKSLTGVQSCPSLWKGSLSSVTALPPLLSRKPNCLCPVFANRPKASMHLDFQFHSFPNPVSGSPSLPEISRSKGTGAPLPCKRNGARRSVFLNLGLESHTQFVHATHAHVVSHDIYDCCRCSPHELHFSICPVCHPCAVVHAAVPNGWSTDLKVLHSSLDSEVSTFESTYFVPFQ